MKRSESITSLAGALAKASEAFPPIERACTAKVVTKSGGSYSYDYADLGDILGAVRVPLAVNGITISHDSVVVKDAEGHVTGVESTAILRHSSGEWLESTPLYIPCDGTMGGAQLIGSARTYGKRYTSEDILGLAASSDDDGNAAAGNEAATGKREPHKAKPPCPKCGKTASVIVGKPDFGGGLVCWKNKEGCGHTWATPEFPGTKDHPAENGQQTPAQLPPDNTAALLAWDARLDPQQNLDLGTEKGNNAVLEEFKAINGKDPIRPVVWNRIVKVMESMGFYFQHKSKTFVPKEPANNEEFA